MAAIAFALLCFFLCLLLINNPGCEAENILYTEESLTSGNSLQYESYTFKMQEDCNLVLYQNDSPMWASNTDNAGHNCNCKMQSDGNLVVYESDTDRVIWASSTDRDTGNYVLILQRDGNLVIYGSSLWATGTSAIRGGTVQ